MSVTQAKANGSRTGPPRRMPKSKALRLTVEALGLVIAVGPCSYQAPQAIESPWDGGISFVDLDWQPLDFAAASHPPSDAVKG